VISSIDLHFLESKIKIKLNSDFKNKVLNFNLMNEKKNMVKRKKNVLEVISKLQPQI